MDAQQEYVEVMTSPVVHRFLVGILPTFLSCIEPESLTFV